MEPRRIVKLSSFDDAYRDLSPQIQEAVDKALRHFFERSNENALKVEKKVGLEGVWAFRVDRGIRIFFVQGKDMQGRTINRLFHVGAHNDYRTVTRKRPR
ncbi:MAG TPA: hypothetical protein VH020_00545 [Stellaceae bacterium]|jgi:mRNA-degrading endonuclease RelE of RelBE toxin-antitoxin system|nr:hypothetical protein [Stellaceae bacterium]